tara:strand:+ start:211 stop:996 length:786 start_codon:yes stop_codon:yes gene_type:complete
MNIHHKNMKQVSHDMQQWVQSHLSHLGIYECGYGHLDIVKGTRMPMTTSYDWYCQYNEKNLHSLIVDRIRNKGKYWHNSNDIYHSYKKFIGKTFHKLDLFNKVSEGYELLTLGCHRLLSPYEYLEVNKAFKQLSYEATKIRKSKPNITLELTTMHELRSMHSHDGSTENQDNSFINYEKYKFQDIVLTAKELKYIEHITLHMNHREIAQLHGCSETAVRKVITNIKGKLKNKNMSTSQMCHILMDYGVLAVCSQSFYKEAI